MPPKVVAYKSFEEKRMREFDARVGRDTLFKIPVVDCSGVFSDRLEDRVRVARLVRQAFQKYGVLYVSNHGVSSKIRSEVLKASQRFFNLPLEEKMGLHESLSGRKRGYQHLGEIKDDEPERVDFREAFKFRLNPACKDQQGLEFNKWPASMPEMEDTMAEYMRGMLRFANHFIRIVALALGAEENVFDGKVDQFGGMSTLHYPPARHHDEEGRAVHSDYSWFTIIDQLSPIPALEVLDTRGDFVSVPPTSETLVINIGECLQRASNHQFMSTIHRVVNNSKLDRYSAVYFFDPIPDTMIRVLDSCISESQPKRYEDIMAGEWNSGLYQI